MKSISVIVLHASIYSGDSSPLAPFATPLPQLLGDVASVPVTSTAFDSLPDTDGALRYCAHLTPDQLAATSPSVSPCDSAKYLAAMKELGSTVSLQPAAGILTQLPSIAAETPFAQIFSEYIEARIAVQLTPSGDDENPQESSLRNDLEVCLRDASPSSALASLAGLSLAGRCPDALNNVPIPALASNDYLVRLTDSVLAGHPSWQQESDELPSSQFAQPPSLLSLQPSAESELGNACPLGMNAAFTVVSGSVDVLLFETTTSAAAAAGTDPGGSGGARANPKVDLVPRFGDDAATLHHLRYAPSSSSSGGGGSSSGWWSAFEHVAKTTSGGGTPHHHRVDARSTLHVPFDTLVALRASGSDGATVLKYCYVDASNLNSVKQHLQLEALTHPPARAFASALSSLRLDTSMTRTPPAGLKWAVHSQWPRPPEVADDSAAGVGGGSSSKRARRSQKDWQADVKWKWRVVGLTIPTLPPPAVIAFGRRNATLNWLSGFRVQEGDSTDFGYNVTWYLGHASSSEVAGFVEVSHADVTDKRDAFDDYHAHDLTYALPEGSLAPATEYTFRVAVYYGEAASPPSGRSRPVVTPSLSAPSRLNTPPTASTLLQGSQVSAVLDAGGQGEEVSAAATTSVQLRSLPPIDDGGSPVVGYVVESRHSEVGMHSDWVIVGSYPAPVGGGAVQVTVDHLIPNTGYEFRLTPYNHVGVAKAAGTPSAHPVFTGAAPATPLPLTPYSASSSSSSSSSTHHHHVLGHGSKVVSVHHISSLNDEDEDGNGGGAQVQPVYLHENAPRVAAHLEAMHDRHALTVHGPVVTLSDMHQTLTPAVGTMASPQSGKSGETAAAASAQPTAFEVWVSHWSPKSWHATAELIVADPPLADKALENAKAVRQRIVLVERGGVPIIEKVMRAQGAGALGVVITDTGECARFDQLCSPGADKKNGDGFAKHDSPGPWSKVRIPVVMMLRDDADALLALFE